MVLKFRLESYPRGVVTLALVQHMTDMRGKRYEAKQMFAKEPLSLSSLTLDEYASGRGQLDGTIFKFREFQDVQSLGN